MGEVFWKSCFRVGLRVRFLLGAGPVRRFSFIYSNIFPSFSVVVVAVESPLLLCSVMEMTIMMMITVLMIIPYLFIIFFL